MPSRCHLGVGIGNGGMPIKRLSGFFWPLRAWKNSSLKMATGSPSPINSIEFLTFFWETNCGEHTSIQLKPKTNQRQINAW